jgi:hypothetical protein
MVTTEPPGAHLHCRRHLHAVGQRHHRSITQVSLADLPNPSCSAHISPLEPAVLTLGHKHLQSHSCTGYRAVRSIASPLLDGCMARRGIYRTTSPHDIKSNNSSTISIGSRRSGILHLRGKVQSGVGKTSRPLVMSVWVLDSGV